MKNRIACPPWEKFQAYPLEERIPYFSTNAAEAESPPFHILYARQFTREYLDEIYVLTNKIRLIAKTRYGKRWLNSLLENYRAMLYFAQPSTRTFLSFATACETMGMRFYDVRSLETSSEVKGETFADMVQTFSSYFDLLILRHSEAAYAEEAAVVLSRSKRPIPLINAGSSKDEHPTQSLLDIFTLRKSFEKQNGLEGKTIAIIGDLKRARTARSLAVLLTKFAPIHILFCSPQELVIDEDIKNWISKRGITYEETDDFEYTLRNADAIYMTRLQSEYGSDTGAKPPPKTLPYTLTRTSLDLLKPGSIIMHPLPRRGEIHPEVDSDPRAMYWRQVRNGMWTRCALVAKIFSVEEKILNQ